MDFKILILSVILCLVCVTEQRRYRHERGKFALRRRTYKMSGRHQGQGQNRRSHSNRGMERNLLKLLPYEAEENVKVRERMNVSLWKVTSQKSIPESRRHKRQVTDDPSVLPTTPRPKLFLSGSQQEYMEQGRRVHRYGLTWPLPQHMFINQDTVYQVNPNVFYFSIGASSRTCSILSEALKRYYKDITGIPATGRSVVTQTESDPSPSVTGDPPSLTHVEVIVLDSCTTGYPGLGSNETYTLQISDDTAYIISQEVWGVLRGLETFSQLVYRHESHKSQLYIKSTYIRDSPRFSHRGVIINSGQRYINTDSIKATLRGMVHNKLNTLHWILSVRQVFSLVSGTGQNPAENSETYRYSDIADIVEFARQRGIWIIPELDTLGIINTREQSLHDLVIDCNYGNIWATSGLLDISSNSTYSFLKEIARTLLPLFPNSPVHLGGFEVKTECWSRSNKFMGYMAEMGFENFHQLLSHHAERMAQIYRDVDKTRSLVLWESAPASRNIGDNVLFQIRNPDSKMSTVAARGQHRIYSWCQRSAPPYQRWIQVYLTETDHKLADPSLSNLVVGGETCIWGEDVDNGNILQTMWPATAAAAERLWSPRHVRNVTTARLRMEEQICRMFRRGIPISPTHVPDSCEMHVP